jgi:lipoate-protein ligase A
MTLLDFTLPTPAENLACDEALLDQADAVVGALEVLRFWESSVPFVVLGIGNRVAEEVDLEACRALGVSVLRRCSGGGTVLQGPGCLNYSLVLNIAESGPLAGITGTNCFVMERHRQALAALVNEPVTVRGVTDLALGDRKFSGNAQRRRRHSLLFHGTFLLDYDEALVQRALRLPPRQPDYRAGRSHTEFLTRLPVARDAIKAALRETWNATKPFAPVPTQEIARLAQEKYSRPEWNLRR